MSLALPTELHPFRPKDLNLTRITSLGIQSAQSVLLCAGNVMTNDHSVTFLSTLFFIRGGGEENLAFIKGYQITSFF